MKLEKFGMKNWRCLSDSGWITMQNPTVLIGCNDGGKTATIEALDYFFGDRLPPTDAYSYIAGSSPDSEGNRPRESEIILEGIFVFNTREKDVLAGIMLVPPADHLSLRKVFRRVESSASFEVKISVPQDPDLPKDPTSLNINQIRQYLAKLKISSPGGNQKEPLLAALMQWLRNQPMKEEWVRIPADVVTLLPLYQRVEGEDPEATIFQILNVSYRQLLKEAQTQQLIQEFENKVDQVLRQPLEAKIATLPKYISKYLPDIVEAKVRPEFSVNAGLKSTALTLMGRDGYRIDLSARGAGTRQQATLAVFEWSSETITAPNENGAVDTILAFDEPDLHLDYGAQRRIYESIESYIKKGVQVIVATHSINFVNRVPIGCIYHYSKPSGTPQTVIECLSPSEDSPDELAFFIDHVGESMGLDNAAIFYERCFLAFEGPTE